MAISMFAGRASSDTGDAQSAGLYAAEWRPGHAY